MDLRHLLQTFSMKNIDKIKGTLIDFEFSLTHLILHILGFFFFVGFCVRLDV